ncbi:MAG: ankyrin repeat domain-containing protein [Leptospiraceae bacterium]|nr:ankyrin repeat domain-containing protein [Leptospiraceae bacterium]MBK7053723.1 ankyrin repeat domain-containing protein [Leptospiraceae bacterium]
MRKELIKKTPLQLFIVTTLILTLNCITTGIHKASKTGDLETAKRLIGEGASINDSDGWSFSPLHYAAENGHLNMAKLLIENGAFVNALDVREYTPLHLAAREGHSEMVYYLLTKGANKELKSSSTAYERTPLDLAVMGMHETTKQVLYDWIIFEEIPKGASSNGQSAPKGIYKDIVTLRNGDILENVKAVVTRNSVVVTNAKGKATEYKKADVKKISLRRM